MNVIDRFVEESELTAIVALKSDNEYVLVPRPKDRQVLVSEHISDRENGRPLYAGVCGYENGEVSVMCEPTNPDAWRIMDHAKAAFAELVKARNTDAVLDLIGKVHTLPA